MMRFARRSVVGPALVASAALLGAPAHAPGCPVCEGPAGRQVRSGIFGPDFASNLLACASPFAVFVAIAAAIHGPRAPRTRPEGGPPPDGEA